MALEVDDDERERAEEEQHPDALERALAVALAPDPALARLHEESVGGDRDHQHEHDQERRERVADVAGGRRRLGLVPQPAAARERHDPEQREQGEGDERQPKAAAGGGGLHGPNLDAVGAGFVVTGSLVWPMAALDGKRAIVTGASSGIGAATARAFEEAGARVYTGSRTARQPRRDGSGQLARASSRRRSRSSAGSTSFSTTPGSLGAATRCGTPSRRTSVR